MGLDVGTKEPSGVGEQPKLSQQQPNKQLNSTAVGGGGGKGKKMGGWKSPLSERRRLPNLNTFKSQFERYVSLV